MRNAAEEADSAGEDDPNETIAAAKHHAYGLTPREIEVLALLCEGYRNGEIAKRLGVTVGVIKQHLHHIYFKLDVDCRGKAIAKGVHVKAVQDKVMQRSRDPAAVRDSLLNHLSGKAWPKGKVLFRRGDKGDGLYYVQKGSIILDEINETIEANHFLGEIAVFSPDERRTCTARCGSDSYLFWLAAAEARHLYMENKLFAHHVTQLLAQRIVAERQRAERR